MTFINTQGTKKLFTGLKAKEMIGAGAPDKKVKTPSLEKFRVFVQNGGGGYRCLKAGTSILYEVIKLIWHDIIKFNMSIISLTEELSILSQLNTECTMISLLL